MVNVVERDGRRARISSPVKGWMSLYEPEVHFIARKTSGLQKRSVSPIEIGESKGEEDVVDIEHYIVPWSALRCEENAANIHQWAIMEEQARIQQRRQKAVQIVMDQRMQQQQDVRVSTPMKWEQPYPDGSCGRPHPEPKQPFCCGVPGRVCSLFKGLFRFTLVVVEGVCGCGTLAALMVCTPIYSLMDTLVSLAPHSTSHSE